MPVATPPQNASNTEILRWSFDAINRQDLEALKQLYTDETVERFPDRTCRGADEIAGYFAEVFEAMPDCHVEVISLVESGDDVFAHWHLTGTHQGLLLGIAPTGKSLAIDGMDHFVVRDGKVVSNFVVFDQMQYARQIGMMPSDDSAADKALKSAFNVRTKLVERIKQQR